MNTRPHARLAGLTLLAVVSLTGCGADDAPDTRPASNSTSEGSEHAAAAAHWLAGQLEQGTLSYRTEFGPFTDVGMSIDAALGLARVGGHESDVAAVADAVAEQVTTYTEFPSGGGTHVSAGGTAKALVLAQVAGADPASFGGTDLVSGLERLVGDTGRVADSFPASNKQDADYANVIGQVYAARGLTEAGSTAAGSVTDHLLQQQCEEGWFRLSFTLDPAATDQGCDADPKAAPDPDVTALAVIHLGPVAEEDPAVDAAIDDAVAWLADEQQEDGSVPGGQPPAANANTTGLAGWAFGEAGETDRAAEAASWLAQVQAGSGAVALDPAALDGAAGGGIPAKARSQWLLATAQAMPALLWHDS